MKSGLRFLPHIFLWAFLFGDVQAGEPSEVTPEGCVVEKFRLPSPAMKRDIEVAVLLPPAYQSKSDRLPVLYALHGMGASYLSFKDMIPLRRFLVDHPMIVVAFNGEESWYLDAPGRPEYVFTTFFFAELVPEINRRFRTDGRMAVTGFSMGGFGALHYLLEHQDRFTSASALSGAFECFDNSPESAQWVRREEELLGSKEKNPEAYQRVALSSRFKRLVSEGSKLPPLLILCGSEDRLRDSNRRFIDMLQTINAEELKKHAAELDSLATPKERNARISEIRKSALIDYEYRETPGGHDWPYWRDTMPAAAEFHWNHFARPLAK
ncbi:MAG: alpha/beta hydrolase [Terrimicrobiaceae bacterium]